MNSVSYTNVVIVAGTVGNIALLFWAWGGVNVVGFELMLLVASPWALLAIATRIAQNNDKERSLVTLAVLSFLLISTALYLPAAAAVGKSEGWSLVVFIMVPVVAAAICLLYVLALFISKRRVCMSPNNSIESGSPTAPTHLKR